MLGKNHKWKRLDKIIGLNKSTESNMEEDLDKNTESQKYDWKTITVGFSTEQGKDEPMTDEMYDVVIEEIENTIQRLRSEGKISDAGYDITTDSGES